MAATNGMLEVERWQRLDDALRNDWDARLRIDEASGLSLPFPFLPSFDVPGPSGAMYNWDTYFVDLGLLRHDRPDLVHNHIRNYLHLVERIGFMPNFAGPAGLTRSQTPVYPDVIWQYFVQTGDRALLDHAYPLLRREYQEYWHAAHHATPVGLTTNRDLGDPLWPPAMAAEAETGLDWTPIYDGDVRRCVPLITNSALVRYANVLASIAAATGDVAAAEHFSAQGRRRAELIRRYCWDDERGIYVEYDYLDARQLPYLSACAYWPLWAGVASAEQAGRSLVGLRPLEHRFGLSMTDREYPDPHPDSTALDERLEGADDGGSGQMQWMHPAGWACMQIIAVEAMDAYGFGGDAARVAERFLRALVERFEETGQLWEKYNVLDHREPMANSRYGTPPMLSWTAGAAILLGRRLFHQEPISPVREVP